MGKIHQVSIKDLHEKTGHFIRLASQSSFPISVTDKGKVIAIISSPDQIHRPIRKRKVLKDFQRVFDTKFFKSTSEDLDSLRADR